VTPKLLRLKKFDGLVQLSRIFRLFDPITLGMIFVRPADEVRSNGLRHTTTRATARLNVEILSGQFHWVFSLILVTLPSTSWILTFASPDHRSNRPSGVMAWHLSGNAT